MGKVLTREEAWELLNEYNKEPFHLRHGETVEGVMRYLAQELGYGDEVDFWGNVCCTIWILNSGLRSTAPRCRS